MKKKKPDSLRCRIADARKRLTERLASGAPVSELEALVHELDILQGLARRRWRHRSVAWAAGGAAILLVTATLLNVLSLRHADFALVANTRALMVVNGAATKNILPLAVPVREIFASIRASRNFWCADPKNSQPGECESVKSLRLNALILNAKAMAKIRTTGSCFEVQVFDGGGQAYVAFQLNGVVSPTGRAHWEVPTLVLTAGDWIRFCPEADPVIQLDDLTSMTVGERTYGALAERKDDPALSGGTLSIVDTAESIELRTTDIPWLGGISKGALVARLLDPIQITLVGRATRIGIGTGSHERSMMPSRLDWVRSGPEFKAGLAVVAAILGAVVAIRERLLGEIG